MAITDYSTSAASNTLLGTIPVGPNMERNKVNDAIQQLMADIAGIPDDGGAALMGFLQSGTGAVARTAQAKMRDLVSVKDFGAVGNGITDDTAAIQAALNSGAIGEIYLSDSVISAPIAPKSNQILIGGKLTAAANSFINAIDIHSIDNCRIEGVEITGNFDTGIRIRNANNISITNCNIHDIGNVAPEYGFGIYVGDYSAPLEYSTNIKISGNTIQNVSGNGSFRGDGVLLAYCSEVSVDGNYIDTVNRMGVAVVANAHSINITNNDILNTALAGVDCEPDSPLPPCYGINVVNNRITNYARSGYSGIGSQFFAVDVHSNAYGVVVSDNIVTPGGKATQIFHCQNGAYDIQFIGNKVLTGGSVGLFLKTYAGSGTNKITVANNMCLAGNVASFIDAFETTNIIVTGNQFAGSGAANSYFVKLVDVTKLTVEGNSVANVTNLLASGIGTCGDIRVIGNTSTTLEHGVNLNASSVGIQNVVISGNTLETPSGSRGINLTHSSGYLRNLIVRGNIIPTATTKIDVSSVATGWDVQSYNNRTAVAAPVAGEVIFEMNTNKTIQYLSGSWVAPA